MVVVLMITLGIESTAHTFGIGVVKDGKVLSNIRDMYTTESGGIIPMESAKHHVKVKEKVYEDALKEAGISEDKIDVIAFSQGPGLAPCLLEGMKFAKELSKRLSKPIVGVNHCVAHLEVGMCRSAYPKALNAGAGAKDAVMLYVSGANTQVIAYEAGKYRVFGETLDLGVGNFIDTFARFAGIGFPGGPKIEKLAEKFHTYIELPYKVKGMDITLSGIQTKLKQMLDLGEYRLEDLAYSLQETVFAMLVETAERALAHTGKNELLLGGGVACNSRLQEMCRIMCKERGAMFFCPERPLLVDNGAFIAYLGEIMYRAGVKINSKDIYIKPRERTDDVDVGWK
jgi:N6-L-threonylcarbamoyladenine synthase